jgi:hypothetical protein
MSENENESENESENENENENAWHKTRSQGGGHPRRTSTVITMMPMMPILAGNVGDMSATREYVANFRSDMPIPATRFSCVGTFLCRDFSDIDVPKTDDIMYIGK